MVDLLLRLTNDCNYNCKHCCYDSGKGSTLSFDQLNSLAKTLPNYFHKILFSGGEPFLHPDILYHALSYLM